MPEVDNNEEGLELRDDGGTQVIDENANADSLRPGGGTAGAGDSKMETIAGLVVKLSDLSNDDLNGFKAMLDQIGKEAKGMNGSADSNRASISAKGAVKKVIKEDLERLFGSEESLSEQFIDNATTLFEAAVTSRVELEAVSLNEQMEITLQEKTEEIVEQFSDRLDTYLEYIAEKWLEDNRIALESGVKTELTESFISGMKNLFAEHYVELPEDKVDIVEALSTQVEQLEEQLNNAINENIEIRALEEKQQAASIVNESVDGLTEVDADRLRTLSEDIDFTTADEFRDRVSLIREKFFSDSNTSSNTGLILEEVEPLAEQDDSANNQQISPTMSRYADAIKRNVGTK